MKEPIIANNKGDVLIFETVKAAEAYIEPIDIRNKEYTIYDSAGRLLRGRIKKVKWHEEVELEEAEVEPSHQEELRAVLINFLKAVSVTKQNRDDYSLEEVLEATLPYKYV
jgi:DNA polymerase III delta prime subunit